MTFAFVATVISVLAMPLVFELVMYRRVGFIWQGRYSIAAALGVAVVGATALHRLPRRQQRQFRRAARALPILAAGSLLLTQPERFDADRLVATVERVLALLRA